MIGNSPALRKVIEPQLKEALPGVVCVVVS